MSLQSLDTRNHYASLFTSLGLSVQMHVLRHPRHVWRASHPLLVARSGRCVNATSSSSNTVSNTSTSLTSCSFSILGITYQSPRD